MKNKRRKKLKLKLNLNLKFRLSFLLSIKANRMNLRNKKDWECLGKQRKMISQRRNYYLLRKKNYQLV
jgi:hypothetical protein